jgi:Flp pilus assembly protein TadG
VSARRQRGSGLTEFALAWPIILLLVLAAIQIAVYGVEAYTARAAALTGARVGSERGASAALAEDATLRTLRPALAGATAEAWCPAAGVTAPRWVWVCAVESGAGVQVRVGGQVPAIVPLPLRPVLPVSADARLAAEVFSP